MNNLKIAFICTEKLPVPPVAGGAVQLYIDGVLPYLSARHEMTVFCVRHPDLPNEEIKDGVRYVRVSGKTDTLYVNNLKSAIDSSFDLIHVFNRPRFVLALMENLPDVKFSLSLHNEMFHPEKIPYDDAVKCIERVRFINTVSKYIADSVKYRLPMAAEKIHVVYSGVDIEKHKPNWTSEGLANKMSMKEKFGLQNHKVVLFVGRLSIKKGVHVLLHAMKKVMAENPKTALVIVGSKWYGKNESDDYVKSLQILAHSLTGPIVFTGFVPPYDIPAYYNVGDVFVCASQWNEPLARVHYEAMASGLPIITTDRGGNAEVVDDCGNGIAIDDYKNPDVMAENISFLLNNAEAANEMGKKGRALAENRFNWARVAEEVIKEEYL